MAHEQKNANGLTERQQAFCEHYVSNGGNGTQAAIAAGYAECAAATRQWELLRNDAVLNEIEVQTRKALRSAVPAAMRTLQGIMNDNSVQPSVRQQAATALLDRGGLKHAERIEITDNLSQDQIKARIAELEKERELLTSAITKPVKTDQNQQNTSKPSKH